MGSCNIAARLLLLLRRRGEQVLRRAAQVVEHLREGRRRQQHAGEVGETLVLLGQRGVLGTQQTVLVVAVDDLLLEGGDVRCGAVSRLVGYTGM
jgi:hypothetical protein